MESDTLPVETDGETEESDTFPAALPVDLSDGFIDLTSALLAAWPRQVAPGDRVVVESPDLTHGVFSDVDGDGTVEVVLHGTGVVGEAATPWVLRYDPVGEALIPDEALSASLAASALHAGLIEDLDGDGYTDLVSAQFDTPVVWGIGPGRWPEVQEPSYSPGQLPLGTADLDMDGWTDILRVPGGCRPGVETWAPWLRTGAKRFEQRLDLVADHAMGNPYVVGAASIGGRVTVFTLGTPCAWDQPSPAFFEVVRAPGSLWPTFQTFDPTPASSTYKQRSAVAGGPMSRVNPMGAAIADLDGDGRVDVAISSVHERPLLFRDPGGVPWQDETDGWIYDLPLRIPDGGAGSLEVMKPWGIAAVDVDRDGRNDLVVVPGDDHSDFVRDTPGLQRPLLMLRRGELWEERGVDAGLLAPSNGRSLAVGDLDRDGRPDLIIGGNGELPRVWLNRIGGGLPGLALHLQGTTSGARADGAVVRASDDGLYREAVMVGGIFSPGPMSENLVFLAAGADGMLDDVEVTWPSGLVQRVSGLAAGQVHRIVEPSLIEVVPPSREVPADGMSEATLRVVPRQPDGAPDPTVAVTVALFAGVGTLVGTPIRDGDAWVQTIRAPLAQGYATLEISLDGVVVPIHPRLRWEDL